MTNGHAGVASLVLKNVFTLDAVPSSSNYVVRVADRTESAAKMRDLVRSVWRVIGIVSRNREKARAMERE